MITEHQVHFKTSQRSKKLASGNANSALAGTIPRVAKMMALAIKFEQMIRDGIVRDQSDLARLGHVTRARMSQIMCLLNLAPDIQEELLHLPPFVRGADSLNGSHLIPIAAVLSWQKQRIMWQNRKLVGSC